jgi:glycosyltransferase involved in cell wall biosynthesis
VAKILFIDQYATLGGGQRILVDLIQSLDLRGHECAACFPSEGPVPDLLRSSGRRTFEYRLPRLSAGRKSPLERLAFVLGARRAARDLGVAAEQFGADLLYCNGGRAVLPALLAANARGIDLVVGVQLIYRGTERALLRWCFRRPGVRLVTFCSELAAEPFADGIGDKGRVLWNWVSPDFLAKPLPDPDRRGEIAVGVLGRISRTKGQRLFLEALLPLLDELPELRLAIGGDVDFEDPGELAVLRRLAAARDDGRVTFAGRVQAIDFLDDLAVLVVPSLWEEPFGLVAVEGMARSLPVVATASGFLPAIVLDGQTGLVVGRDPAELRAAVARLVRDAPLRARLGTAGRARVEEAFEPTRQLASLAELIEGVIRNEAPRRRDR